MPYYVYFMTNKHNRVLYVGVTNNIKRRVYEHKNDFSNKSFTSHYECRKLVYVQEFPTAIEAITSEKKIKNRSRKWKDELVDKANPGWYDLYEQEWGF